MRLLGTEDARDVWDLFRSRGVWSSTDSDVRELARHLSDRDHSVVGVGTDRLDGASVLCFDMGVPHAWATIRTATRKGSGCLPELREAVVEHAAGRGCHTLYYMATHRNAELFGTMGPDSWSDWERTVLGSRGDSVAVRVRRRW